MKTQELKEYIAAHPGWTARRMCQALKSRVSAAEMHAAMSGTPQPAVQNIQTKTIGQPLTNLISQFDDVAKVAKAMKALPKDSYFDDDEMRRNCGVNPDRWKAVCQHPTLVPFRFALPRGNKHVWMHQAAQAKLTAAINLDQQ